MKLNIFKRNKPSILNIVQDTTPKEREPLPPPPKPPQQQTAPVLHPETPAVTLDIVFQALKEIYQYQTELGAYIYEKLEGGFNEEEEKTKPKK